jgi:crotonobetainyl-CoA:carnitine CoA-transferase CaiB-like acyl-CoA transferase
VFVQNWRPGVAGSLNLSFDDVVTRNPALVYVAITGFGQTGPRSTRPVFDALLRAASGFASLEAGRTAPPVNTRSFLADKTTASFAAQAIIAALFWRTRSGSGLQIDLAMLDAMAYFDFPDLGQDRTFLPPAPRVDLEPSRSGMLKTSDGYVMVAPVTGRQIAAAMRSVGHPEWKDELKRLDSPVELVNVMYDLLESVTHTRTTAECEALFLAADVPAQAVLDMDTHLADAQTMHNELYSVSDSPIGPIRRIRYPARIAGCELPQLTPAQSTLS